MGTCIKCGAPLLGIELGLGMCKWSCGKDRTNNPRRAETDAPRSGEENVGANDDKSDTKRDNLKPVKKAG